MAQVKFGPSQVDNPTPSNINLWVRVFTVAAALFLSWMSTASLIGPHTKDILTQVLGLLLLLTNGLAPLFGVQLSGGNVPVKDVAAVDSNASNN